ncbi:MAG TPA: MarR family winged helix-turn-helix transcriptional regulator [Actinophytocola sp.]|uniref:MarR family winged helix-turn-helix transcriptional regulator n=1 Tax=Actinophytocola sp. TaxID=1872138 RepID=UPI002DB7E54A|nr:MarR family winged helix-turn-helix transcriptional regulator [Actinophytocola sp.]HEU5471385.1 MarR family winged helix-turn-helix transcriptional regulator [Actinophytocola sp.]
MPESEREDEFFLPEPLLQFPSFVLIQLAREARRIGGLVHEDDLRMPHVTVLATVDEFGPAAQKDISRRLRIDASDLVSVLDDLEERGLVRRKRDDRDRRRYLVTITEAGVLALDGRLTSMRKLNDILLGVLSPEERERFAEMLIRVYRRHDPKRVPVELVSRLTSLSRSEPR